jgi:hypothetical protein
VVVILVVIPVVVKEYSYREKASEMQQKDTHVRAHKMTSRFPAFGSPSSR